MANDRMFLVNKITNKKFLLAKHLGGGWYIDLNYHPDCGKKDMGNSFQEYLNDNNDAFFENPHAYIIEYEDEDKCEYCIKRNDIK